MINKGMKLSTKGVYHLLASEAFCATPYLDSVGVWTIAFGQTGLFNWQPVEEFKGEMTIAGGLDLFKKMIVRYEKEVASAFTVKLEQHEFDAAVSFHYNTGAIGYAKWVDGINNGSRAEVFAENTPYSFMNWSKPREIIGRRKDEQKLFELGLYKNKSGAVIVYVADKNGKATRSTIYRQLSTKAPDPQDEIRELKAKIAELESASKGYKMHFDIDAEPPLKCVCMEKFGRTAKK